MTDAPTPRAMWGQRYGGESYHYGVEPNDFLRSNEHHLPSGPA